MEWVFGLLGTWAQKEDSIFYFFLFLSAVAFLAAEGEQLYRFLLRRSRNPTPKSKRPKPLDPTAPIGWAIAPAFFLILLAFVQWGAKARNVAINADPAPPAQSSVEKPSIPEAGATEPVSLKGEGG